MEISRPPIVAVLGHVDHGKTSLLDALRKTNVAAREVGGITQHIGAYQIKTSEGKVITFIDTPGHEAFSKMRSRGANVADIVLLVVAGDDGVKPQTRESLAHIKAAGVPFIVVITKIDLANAQIERVKEELEKEGIKLEGRGGDVVVVPVSSKTGEGLAHLLEMITLLSELHEINDLPDSPLEAVVIESQFDSKKGPVATVIVRAGKISVGDVLDSEGVGGKVKALLDENGKRLPSVLPGSPVQILGFEKPPAVGSQVSLKSESKKRRKENPVPSKAEEGLVKLIIKADTQGRLEALVASLPPEVEVLSSGVGEVTASDVMLASSFDCPLLTFGVRTPSDVAKLAEEEKITIASFPIIYEAIDWVRKELAGSEEKTEEKLSGKGEIIALFPYGEDRKIAGVKSTEGKITKSDVLTLIRHKEVVGKVRIASLKKGDQDVDKVEKGQECGIIFKGKVDFQVGDVIVSKYSNG